MFKILFLVTALSAIYCEANFIPIIIWDKSFQIPSQELIRAKRQLFGGVPSFPRTRTNQEFGGSIFSTPTHDVSAWGSLTGYRPHLKYGGSVDWTAPRGGLSLGGSHAPHDISSFTVGTSASIFRTPEHNVGILGAHTRGFDKNFKPLGSFSAGGLGYQYTNKDSNTNLGLLGGVKFGSAIKPSPVFEMNFEKKFR